MSLLKKRTDFSVFQRERKYREEKSKAKQNVKFYKLNSRPQQTPLLIH